MIAYLDTQVVVWLSGGDEAKLTVPARAEIERADLRISPMVVLELEYLYEIKRLIVPSQDIISKLQLQIGVIVCDYSFPAIMAAAVREKWTRDPFDRVIVAHSRANQRTSLISADRTIRKHYTETVW